MPYPEVLQIEDEHLTETVVETDDTSISERSISFFYLYQTSSHILDNLNPSTDLAHSIIQSHPFPISCIAMLACSFVHIHLMLHSLRLRINANGISDLLVDLGEDAVEVLAGVVGG